VDYDCRAGISTRLYICKPSAAILVQHVAVMVLVRNIEAPVGVKGVISMGIFVCIAMLIGVGIISVIIMQDVIRMVIIVKIIVRLVCVIIVVGMIVMIPVI
jgi:hypothetical protein